MQYHLSSPRILLNRLPAAICVNSWRAFHLLQSGSRALFEGFWLGLLSDSATDLVSELSYGKGTEYIGPAYLDSGLQFWEKIAVQRFFPTSGKVLIGAAGGDREAIALARAGYQVEGFECSRAMVAAGQSAIAARGLDCRLEWAPPCRVPEKAGQWDAAIIGWNGYTYISPRRRRLAFLKDLGRRLRPGAPLLVSGALRANGKGVVLWTPRIANAVRRLTFRNPEFGVGTCFPGHPRHEFSRRELEVELAEAGFAAAAFWKWGPFAAMVAHRGGVPKDTGASC